MKPEDISDPPDLAAAFKVEARHYDGAGNLVLREEFDGEGNVTEKFTFEFNEKGLVTRHGHYFEEELSEEELFEYNEMGNPVRETKRFADGSLSMTVSEYDGSGKILSKKTTAEDGSPEGHEEFTYEDDRLINHSRYDEEGQLTEKMTQVYVNTDGKWILKETIEENIPDDTLYRTVHDGDSYIVYDRKGSRYASQHRIYDEKGRLTEHHYSTLARDLSAYYSYDEEGRLMEEKRTTGDSVTLISKRFYADDGSLKMMNVTDAASGMFTDLIITEKKDQAS